MTTTDELREAVARAIRDAVFWSTHAPQVDDKGAADRIIRLIVDACINEVPGGNICDPQEIADRIRALAPEESK